MAHNLTVLIGLLHAVASLHLGVNLVLLVLALPGTVIADLAYGCMKLLRI